jgi:hypothetical protein
MANDETPKECWSRTPRYRPGGKLTAEQLNASQADAVLRDRLVNVAMHGVGVAHGFEIRTEDSRKGRVVVIEKGRIHIGCGLAFDKYGRMLVWRGGWIGTDDLIGPKPDAEGSYTLRVHYAEKSDRGGAFDPCHDGGDWVDRCVAFTLCRGCEARDCCAPDVPCEHCMTRKEWVCTRSGFHPGVVPKDDELDFACECPPELAASDCGRVAYDPEAGIPLTCLWICDLNERPQDAEDEPEKAREAEAARQEAATAEQQPVQGGPGYDNPDRHPHDCPEDYGFCPCHPVESCAVRPVVYRNPLLYEIANDDDVRLSKVKSYSWSDWKIEEWSEAYRVPFSAFAARAKACKSQRHKPEDGFMIEFTCPVKCRTLHPLSVLMEIYIRENRPHYWMKHRVPIAVRCLDRNGQYLPEGSHHALAWGLVICPLDDWIKYEIDDENSTILDCANRGQLARVEITLVGSDIRDRCNLMLDARPPDIDRDDPCGDRAGQAMPGGLARFTFRVGPNAAPGHGYDTEEDKAREKYASPADDLK